LKRKKALAEVERKSKQRIKRSPVVFTKRETPKHQESQPVLPPSKPRCHLSEIGMDFREVRKELKKNPSYCAPATGTKTPLTRQDQFQQELASLVV
jgi:hypothetical protein